MFEDLPIEVGIIYEGERIRCGDTQVELGGPQEKYKFELVKARGLDAIEDGKINIVGPDLKDLKPQSNHPFGILIEVAGKEIEEDLEGVVERRIHEYINFIEGFMHLNQRYDIHLRLNKKSFEKGLTSFTQVGQILQRLYKSEMPLIEKIQINFITDPEKIKDAFAEAVKTYEARDAKARGMQDEEADAFYGCTLCQSFAPSHCCVITPQRYSNCGAISWFDGRAAARIDPKGPLFTIEKGECIDPWKGEYTGANAALKEKTLGGVDRVWLYSAFGYPHTSCGCFEGLAFIIPEVDGMGLVYRDFKGKTVNGLAFSTMADSAAGGRQVDGFHGVSIEYLRSPKFLQVDGGWNRIVWMPANVKERVKDFIPKDLVDKIATDQDVETVDQLKEFLQSKEHPVVERWKAEEVVVEEAITEKTPAVAATQVTSIPVSGIPMAAGGLKIILKDAKIVANKLIIKISKDGE
ncbi:MAG: CO dehydrogenase/CO-methylating acetyl-CoA synthase complex subunit beta [Candidatus Bathyarchaeota archaeon]|nr:MAG: CO dehydrogenase/CO-methylating acetyl-CoA synthase complex subunit beta [Candidatus Bathyarchaeota archaeon]